VEWLVFADTICPVFLFVVEALLVLDDGLSSEWRGRGDNRPARKLTQGELSRLLRPFGIRPRTTPMHAAVCEVLHKGVMETGLPVAAMSSNFGDTPMTKLALLILFGAGAAPSVHARDAKDARRDIFDVCKQFVINEPDQSIRFGFSRDCILYDPDTPVPEWRTR
jgi:hypothetical protein